MSLYVDIKKKFKDFSLEVSFSNDNGTLGILGASGSGKSMTLKCIAGLTSPDEGIIRLGDRVLFDSAAKIDLKPQQRNVGYLFQSYALFPNMTVRKNIEIAYGGPKENIDKAVDELLQRYELTDLADRYPVQISGGQQQRTALARIFAYEPELILLDEPFSALDTYLRENMQAELKRIIKSYNGDVVMVTHSRDEAYKICDNLVILEDGQPVTKGKTQDIFTNPRNVASARITGCKNISEIIKTGETTFIAKDWGIELDAETTILDNHTHIGIRAHDFFSVDETNEEKKSINVFDIRVDHEIVGMFEKNVIFCAKNPVEYSGEKIKIGPIWWITDTGADVENIAFLSVEPNKILLLEE